MSKQEVKASCLVGAVLLLPMRQTTKKEKISYDELYGSDETHDDE
jgi:hypothetical protein